MNELNINFDNDESLLWPKSSEDAFESNSFIITTKSIIYLKLDYNFNPIDYLMEFPSLCTLTPQYIIFNKKFFKSITLYKNARQKNSKKSKDNTIFGINITFRWENHEVTCPCRNLSQEDYQNIKDSLIKWDNFPPLTFLKASQDYYRNFIYNLLGYLGAPSVVSILMVSGLPESIFKRIMIGYFLLGIIIPLSFYFALFNKKSELLFKSPFERSVAVLSGVDYLMLLGFITYYIFNINPLAATIFLSSILLLVIIGTLWDRLHIKA